MGFQVGVSGFSYPTWKGRFYPDSVKADGFLAYYSGQLNSVEINSTFYAFPSQASVSSWSSKTKELFKFAFKSPKQVTHISKLSSTSSETANRFFRFLEPLEQKRNEECRCRLCLPALTWESNVFEAAERLSRVVGLLGSRRGPILFQLPPFFRADHALLEDFLTTTAGIERRVFEFRHESWFSDATFRLLDSNKAGFCIAESEDVRTELRTTGGFAYFRLRKESYEAIEKWSKEIKKIGRDVPECFVYLRHDETGENAILARQLSESLGASVP
jgi:uncharacterized protein YecE (DUF72 family)